MTLLSASEDFSKRTLAHLSGALPRLHYIAGLRDGNGRYRHWGLARTYGEQVAHETAVLAHFEALTDVLRSSLPRLYAEVVRWDVATAAGAERCLAELLQSLPRLLPSNASATSRRHLNSILLALHALARARANSTLPAA